MPMNNQVQPSKHSIRSSARLKKERRDSEAQPTGEDKIINQGFQCGIGKKEELFNPGLEKSCNSIPLSRSTRLVCKYVDGQLSFFKYAIPAPPEIFTYAHYVRKLTGMNCCISMSIYIFVCL